MARKPNYRFERKERERVKAAKKAERTAAKEEARKRKAGQPENADDGGDGKATEPSY